MKTLTKHHFAMLSGIACLFLLFFASCEKSESQLVINEIMPSNHSGITAANGELYDWIEVKNTSDKQANLKDYTLRVEKIPAVKKNVAAGEDAEGDDTEPVADSDTTKGKIKTWNFPSRVINPGECVIVFASKKESDNDKELHASFKVSAQGGKIELLHNDNVADTVTYGKLNDDQCYRRLDDGTFEVSYEQTPGADNTSKNFEIFCEQVEKQRTGPLRLWEYHSRGYKKGRAWIEIKNVSDSVVDLQSYCLTTASKDMSRWAFPAVQLQPGEFYVVDCLRDSLKVGGSKSVMLTRDGKFVDGIRGGAPSGSTTGRVVGKDGFFYFQEPTRGAENTTPHYRTIALQPEFEEAPGVVAEKKN